MTHSLSHPYLPLFMCLLESWQYCRKDGSFGSIPSAKLSGISYSPYSAIASDGAYLYVLAEGELLKIGTGFEGTLQRHVYSTLKDPEFAQKAWLCYIGGVLYFRSLQSTFPVIRSFSADSLKVCNLFPFFSFFISNDA